MGGDCAHHPCLPVIGPSEISCCLACCPCNTHLITEANFKLLSYPCSPIFLAAPGLKVAQMPSLEAHDEFPKCKACSSTTCNVHQVHGAAGVRRIQITRSSSGHAMQAESHPANLLSKNAFVQAIFTGRPQITGQQPPETTQAEGSVIVRFQTW